jgi:hypothetical protein
MLLEIIQSMGAKQVNAALYMCVPMFAHACARRVKSEEEGRGSRPKE